MSIFQGEISWNEIKKIVEEKVGGGLKVQGDGEVVYLKSADLTDINNQDGTLVYFGSIQVNSFHSTDVIMKFYDSTSTETVTLSVTSPTDDVPVRFDNVLFSLTASIATGAGYNYFIGYKITLA